MTGKITSQGDWTTGAEVARHVFNVDGSGIDIGIISTSFDALGGASSDVASGDLPTVQVLKDLPANSPFAPADDEGRALAQIIHDVAPGASLLFRTGGITDPSISTSTNFVNALNDLTQAGADIIVNDISFPSSIFQDGAAAQAISDITQQGITYITAAGNNGSISYESPYKTDGTTFDIAGITFEAFNFGTQQHPDLFQDIQPTQENSSINPLLSWDEPNGQTSSNLQMFLLNTPELPKADGSNVLGIGGLPSLDPTDSSLRILPYALATTQPVYLMIAREENGTPPPHEIKWISTASGVDRTTQYEYLNSTATIFGQENARDAITVGAADFNDGLPEARSYSSVSSVPVLFNAEGERLLFPENRQKPDIFAPDGISTTFETSSPFNPFNGTSAAAPHIAGIVALMQQKAGGARSLSTVQTREILQESAIPVMSGSGEVETAGFVQADWAVSEVQTLPFGIPFSSFLTQHLKHQIANFSRAYA
jgi:hypothetical protein